MTMGQLQAALLLRQRLLSSISAASSPMPQLDLCSRWLATHPIICATNPGITILSLGAELPND